MKSAQSRDYKGARVHRAEITKGQECTEIMRGQKCTYQGINVGKIVLNRVYMEDNIVQSRVSKGIRVLRIQSRD